MAQQSARRGRKNQAYSSCLEHAFMIWFRPANSHTGPQRHRCTIRGRTDGSIRLRANFFKNRLHLAGRPQMSTRPSVMGPMMSSLPSERHAAELMLLSVVNAWPPHLSEGSVSQSRYAWFVR
jgi:hypothetical protein